MLSKNKTGFHVDGIVNRKNDNICISNMSIVAIGGKCSCNIKRFE